MTDNVLEVDMTTLGNLAGPILKQGFPLLIMGRHGIGKSEFVFQVAEQLGMEVVEMRPSVMQEGDVSGLPFKGPSYTLPDGEVVTSTKFSPPEWFLKACTKGVILFFDEADRGSMQVAQSLFQLNDSRKLNEYKLHPDTRIVACINGGRFGQLYQVREMDLAEFDRYAKMQLEPTVEEWLSWADRDNNMMFEFISFFRSQENHRFLENTKDEIPMPGKIYPSRRSWARYSKVLAAMPEFKNGFTNENQILARSIGAAFVGIECAHAFVNHANSVVRVINPEIVFMKGRTDVLASFTPMDHEDFMTRAFESGILTGDKLKKIPQENMEKYLKTVPAEQVVAFLMKIAKNNINDLTSIQDIFERFSMGVGDFLQEVFFVKKVDVEATNASLNKNNAEEEEE